MSRNVLLVLADAAEAKAVRRSLIKARDDPFKVEWVSGCDDAIKRLGDQGGEEITSNDHGWNRSWSTTVDTGRKEITSDDHRYYRSSSTSI